jgi:antitoxin ParD1/3/4
MPTVNLSLTEEQQRFVAECVSSGRYPDAAAVVEAGLRLLCQDEQEDAQKLAVLRQAIQDGIDSPDAEPGVFERLRDKYRLPQREQYV